ncbi:hypothetical protein CAEBREN_15488 [Caenorhabditis brenneri]|uniref:Galectin n=1 Tax=Caenorhabditis brenneri TaxID=135651 RepID=G0MY60_CAEBE|nr:hypothetical protein CAEBREN_15488 [Caenorhabditis brenneri]
MMQYMLFFVLYLGAVHSAPLPSSFSKFNKQRTELLEAGVPEVLEAPADVPTFKHIGRLDNVQEGTEVLVEGTFTGRFDIDLKCESGSFCVPLHICVRPAEQAFVFNAKFPSGIYDLEERRYFFLEKLTFFRVSIVVRLTHFEVTVNDHWTKMYEHRMNFEQAKQIMVKGDVSLDLLEIYQPESMEEPIDTNEITKKL